MAKGRRRQRRRDVWSYTTGEKGLNRVKVYEREPGRPLQICIYIRGQAHRETLRNLNDGVPIFDRDLAKEIADAVAMDRRQRAEARTAREILGRPIPYTLHELFAELHNTREAGWSSTYLQQQRSIRDWWLDALGADTVLTDVDAATASRRVDAETRRRKWSTRTQRKYLRYLKDAYIFANRDKKWIPELHNLSELKMPSQDSRSLPYTADEMLGILRVAPDKDLRMAAATHIAFSTLSRIGAIRQLRADDVEYETIGGVERMRLRFRAETEKRDKDGYATPSATARRYIEMLLQRPAVQSSGWLLPRGDLDVADPDRSPMSDKVMSDWIKWCEERAGVERVRGRGWHSIKRGMTRLAGDRLGGLRAVSKQARTTEGVLKDIYDHDSPEARAEVADALEGVWQEYMEAAG